MGKVARIISSKIEDDKIICTCEIYKDYNVQAVFYNSPGCDDFPMPDDRTFLSEDESSGGHVALGIWTNNEKTLEKGEKFLFSRDEDNNIVSSLYMQNDGKVDINTTGNLTTTIKDGNDNTKIILALNNDGKASLTCKDNITILAQDGTTDEVKIQINKNGKLIIDTKSDIDVNCSGKITLDADTTIEFNGNSKKLITDTLSTLLTAFVNSLNGALASKMDGAGSTGTLTLDITSAKTTTLKTGG
jgi:hypothetical protein